MGRSAASSEAMKSESQFDTLSKVATAMGWREKLLREELLNPPQLQEYFSIAELASRWRCSRGTVYNRLRLAGAKVLDFGVAGRKSKKLVAAAVVFQLEAKYTKALP